MQYAKRQYNKVIQVINGWTTMAPEAILAGMKLGEFKTAVKPFLDSQAKITELEVSLSGERKEFINHSHDCSELVLRVVDGVKSDAAYGRNSSLYKTMGYVAQNERKSGRTWKTAALPEEVAPKS